jgi:catechol 2,3-dioxygenase-like lactoylglutathione lyase family enzyme
MLKITQVDHLGIRISDIARSRAFYERLGFAVVRDAGYEDGHPVVMVHPSGVVVNLLGPSTAEKDTNMLMDVTDKYSGYTHAALRVESIAITGGPARFSDDMVSLFIRDPDRNVIELTEHGGRDLEPDYDDQGEQRSYRDHP